MTRTVALPLPEGIELEAGELEKLTSGWLHLVEEVATFKRGARSGSANLQPWPTGAGWTAVSPDARHLGDGSTIGDAVRACVARIKGEA